MLNTFSVHSTRFHLSLAKDHRWHRWYRSRTNMWRNILPFFRWSFSAALCWRGLAALPSALKTPKVFHWIQVRRCTFHKVYWNLHSVKSRRGDQNYRGSDDQSTSKERTHLSRTVIGDLALLPAVLGWPSHSLVFYSTHLVGLTFVGFSQFIIYVASPKKIVRILH